MSMFHELMMRKKEQIMYATIKGSLTESPEGVFSGFTSTNYLSLDCGINTINQWEISIDFSYTVAPSSYRGLFSRYSPAFQIYMTSTKKLFVEINGSTDLADFGVLTLNSDYNIKIKYNAGSWNMVLTNKTTETIITKTSSTSDTWYLSGIFRFGITQSGSYGWDNTINLNTSYLKLGSTKYKLQAVVGYTIVGSPTITDGVVSGFSTSDYLSINTAGKISSADTWEMCFKLGTSTTGYFLGSNVADVVTYSPARSQLYLSSNGTSWDIASGIGTDSPVPDNCYLRIKFTGTQYIAEYSTDKISWIATSVVNSSVKIVNFANLYIGKWQSSYYRGSIDMNETYIKINNKLWFNGQQA